MTRNILFSVASVLAVLLAFFFGRSTGHSEFSDYMIYAEIEQAWAKTTIIDLLEENDCTLLRERLMFIEGLDAAHEAGIAMHPERFRESIELGFDAYLKDYARFQDVQNYALTLLELRYEKLKKHEWFAGSNSEDRLLKNIEALRGQVNERTGQP